jgi:hypothetical protein
VGYIEESSSIPVGCKEEKFDFDLDPPKRSRSPFWDTTHDADDNVLYHSLLGLASQRVQFVGYRDQSIAELMSDLRRVWLELGRGVFP